MTLLLIAVSYGALAPPDEIVDSHMTRAEALGHNHFPKRILARMEIVEVRYLSFDGKKHRGQIVVDRALAREVKNLFEEMEELRYPIKKVVPIVAYHWDDQASIDDDNTSGFNYRGSAGPGTNVKILSHHSFGWAIDLNPYLNPFVSVTGQTPRPYVPGRPGVLSENHPVVKLFKRHGWIWGGDWRTGKDYQHFEKPPKKR